MKAEATYQIDLSFNQILKIVKQLPISDKIKLSKELEKEAIDSKLTMILKALKTDELTEEMIQDECNLVREKIFLKRHGVKSNH
jgi:hypothetical protein